MWIVGCGKEKGPEPARAADLYTGSLFRAQQALADRQSLAADTFILSAQYGLIAWFAEIEP